MLGGLANCIQVCGLFGDVLLCVEVAVEPVEWMVAQIQPVDLGTGGTRGGGGQMNELLIIRACAGAASKGEDFGSGHTDGYK